ncbi:MAG: DHH family phosphoesterase [Bacteroidota bacterium]|nr:DHH family phosphoesterase [Bacteroidota bacterium]MDP4212638.1 DHH family phosphoesterase [Bacteroidota bacterium]MDP4251586.1 DHH family phosphoesterase [Bacteroidota bacterium]
MQQITDLFPLLNVPKTVVIVMHQKPDADAMGSSLGLYHVLTALGHSVTVISPTNWADWLKWIKGADKVVDYELNGAKANDALAKAELIFCLDFNTLSRARKMAEPIARSSAIRILIDHHQQPQEEMFTYGISDTSKSSTSEMIFDFIIASGNGDKIHLAIAECLYAGVMTDTGSFRFSSTTASVHRMVACLKDTGFDHARVHEKLFDNFLENRLRFTGHALLNCMEIFYEYNSALICIPWKDLVKFQIRTGDSEGLVNYPLTIQGIKFSALIIDRDEEIKCSFRSKGGFDVNSYARQYFEGGGHFNAAGGRSSDTLEKAAQKFRASLKENALQLQ